MRRLKSCPGAADTVERARIAARARRAAVAGLDDRLRAAHRVAHRAMIVASHAPAFRAENEGAQQEARGSTRGGSTGGARVRREGAHCCARVRDAPKCLPGGRDYGGIHRWSMSDGCICC